MEMMFIAFNSQIYSTDSCLNSEVWKTFCCKLSMTVTEGCTISHSQAWHLVSDDAYHVTLGWSEFMGGYSTANGVVKDWRRSKQLMKFSAFGWGRWMTRECRTWKCRTKAHFVLHFRSCIFTPAILSCLFSLAFSVHSLFFWFSKFRSCSFSRSVPILFFVTAFISILA